jgi:hypothetical protein
MKTVSSLAILFATTSILAQSPAIPSSSDKQATQSQLKGQTLALPSILVVPSSPDNGENCPITFTSARLDRPAEYMPVASTAKFSSSLHLSYSIPWEKPIATVQLTGHLLVKQNRYALDATSIAIPLTFTPEMGEEINAEARIPLSRNVVGFNRLTLDSITYQDGTVWRAAKEHRLCSFASHGTEKVAK